MNFVFRGSFSYTAWFWFFWQGGTMFGGVNKGDILSEFFDNQGLA